jgi:ankyrin repeat protein
MKKLLFTVSFIICSFLAISQTSESAQANERLGVELGKGNDIDWNEVKANVEKGGDPNYGDSYVTLLSLACNHGNLEIAKYLVEKGAKINLDKNYPEDPLVGAVRSGNKELIKYLISKGANVNAINMEQLTAFSQAISMKDTVAARILLEAGYDKNYLSESNPSEVYNAYLLNDSLTINWLLDRNFKLKKTEANELLAEETSKEFKEMNWKMVKAAVSNGAELNKKNYFYDPLVSAAAANNMEMVEFLIRNGNNINPKKIYDYSALLFAIVNGNDPMATLLISKGATLNFKLNDAASYLHYAAMKSSPQVVSLLLKKGADVHAVDGNDRTPIFYAAASNRKEIVELLLAKKAKINAMDVFGVKPVYIAAWNNNVELTKYLVSKGADFSTPIDDPQNTVYNAKESLYFDIPGLQEFTTFRIQNELSPEMKAYLLTLGVKEGGN